MFRLLLLVALVACGGSPAKDNPNKPLGSDPQLHAVAGYEELMQRKTLEGASLETMQGPTAVVVFASWCGPCRYELATLGHLRKKYPSLNVIGINAYEEYNNHSDQERLRAYVGANAPWLTQIVHGDTALLHRFGKVPKIPTLFVYNEQGGLVAEFRRNRRSPPTHEELDKAIGRAH